MSVSSSTQRTFQVRVANNSTLSRHRSCMSKQTFVCYYCCFITTLILFSSSSLLLLTYGQNTTTPTATTTTTTTTTIPTPTSEQYPANTTTSQNSILQVSPAVTPGKNPASNNSIHQQQPKSLKFTLIAGKLWRFNIRPNSFFNYKEGELRLHKNVSFNNYIIDDDGWFQYNPQQQQLFSWPSLSIKPGTYHFVLLPSGVDFEADSENTVSVDVVANIVVELIRPLYQGLRNDIDQLIDHKFSLDFLHRHQAYPLLLQQIVSVFDTILRANNNITQHNPIASNVSTTTSIPTTTLTAVLAQQKSLKLVNKLSEYLLISSIYSSDGEFFSLTWSTHPGLSTNNSITQISECRLSTINDTVTKLSSLSSGQQSEKEKFVIYYPLDAPFANSQAIVPTERGNNALKLILNGPCQKEKIVDELGIVPSSASSSLTAPDVDDKENNIVDLLAIPTASKVVSLKNSTVLLASEAIDSGPANTTQATYTTTTTTSTTKSPLPISIEAASIPATTVKPVTSTVSIQSSTTAVKTSQTSNASTTQATSNNSTLPSPITARKVNKLEAQVVKSEESPLMQQPPPQPPKTQPQAKSFADFLDSNNISIKNATMTTTTTPRATNISAEPESNLFINVVPSNFSNTSSVEASLNEELIGIVDSIMNYLLSVAIPVAIIVGVVLLICTLVALCSLYNKKKKSKQLKVRNRFDFRYGSERRGFLKNSSEPVILDADQKSISMGGTPKHGPSIKQKRNDRGRGDYKPVYATSGFGGDTENASST